MCEKSDLQKKIVNREKIFDGHYLHLERLQIELPDGRTGEREVVAVPDAVAVLPLDADGNVHMVRQHRTPINRTLLEVPAGIVDEGERPEETAFRECEEETGYRPGKLRKLLYYAHAEGYSTGHTTLFLGTDLKHTGKIKLDSSELLEQVSLPFDELVQLIHQNKIYDSKTILCVLLFRD